MQLTSPQHSNGFLPVSWRFVWVGLALLLATWPVAALSQSPFPADPYAGAPVSDPLLFEEFSGRSGQAFGGVVRGGFVTGPGIGREDSFAPLEFMPYFFLNEGMLFGDFRGFRSVQDGFGANVGVGYRQYLPKWDRIIGANFYYDYDNTSGQLFRQVGFGLETLGPLWDMRANAYFPVTETRKELSLSNPIDLRFNANNILYDQIRTFGVHLKGLDHELSVPLPGRILERHNIRASAGWYHFQQERVDSTWGWKGRLEGDATANVHMGLEVTNDNTFDTNVVFSVAVSYGGFRQPEGQRISQFNRMTEHVNRQYTTVIQRDAEREEGLVALKSDGTPIFVEHVASEDPYDRSNPLLLQVVAPQYDPLAPLGTFENPYLTIADAQDPGTVLSDITFVWTNSVFDNTTVVTESGVRLLGEADNAPHIVNINGRDVLLPRAVNNPNPNPTDPFDPRQWDLKPIFTFSDRIATYDAAVELTGRLALPDGTFQRTEFSGFRIGDELDANSGSTSIGILARPDASGVNVTEVDVNFVEVNHALGDGIQLNSVGQVGFLGTRIFNAGENGLHVLDGNAQITYQRGIDLFGNQIELTYNQPANQPDLRTEIQHDGSTPANGYAVQLTRLGSNANVNLAPLNQEFYSRIRYNEAGGVQIFNSAGVVGIGDLFVSNSPVSSVNIITDPLDLSTRNTGSFVFRGPVSIQAPQADAINIQNLGEAGVITFANAVEIGTDLAIGGRAGTARGVALGTDPAFTGNDGDVNFLGGLTIRLQPGSVGAAAAFEYQRSAGDVTLNNVNGGPALTINGSGGEGILIGTDDPNINNTGTFRVLRDASISNAQGISLQIIEDDSTIVFDRNLTIEGRGDRGINIERQRAPVQFNGVTRVTDQAANTGFDVAVNVEGTPFVSVGAGPPPVFDPLVEANGRIFFNVLTIEGADNIIDALPSGMHVHNMQAPVVLNELNITSDGGIALLVEQVGNPFGVPILDAFGNPISSFMSVDTGRIQADDSLAIDARNSRLSMRFAEVSSSDSFAQGIRLVNNALGGFRPTIFTLEVDAGTTPLPGDGGQIEDASLQGILVLNGGNTRFNGIAVEDNGQEGILVTNVDSTVVINAPGIFNQPINVGTIGDTMYSGIFRLENSLVADNTQQGLWTIDVREVNLSTSIFEDNGGPFDAEIRLQVTRDLEDRNGNLPTDNVNYLYRIIDTNVTKSSNANAIEVLARGVTAPDAFGRPTILGGLVIPVIGIGDSSPSGNPSLDLIMLGTNLNEPVITLEGGITFPTTTTITAIIGGVTVTTTVPDQQDAALLVNWDGPASVVSEGYTYISERDTSYGVRIEQNNRNSLTFADFNSNIFILGVPGTGIQGDDSALLSADIEGFSDFVINDNVFFIDESANGSTGIQLNFRREAVVEIGGTRDNINPDLIIPDPLNDFGDDLIEYAIGPVGTNPPNLVTVEGPFGNIILMHANDVQAIDLTFNAASQATIENNVIANEPGVIDFLQRGILISNRISLELFGSLNNGVLLDDDGRFFNFGDQNVTNSIAPWFEIIGPGTVEGSILINGDPVP